MAFHEYNTDKTYVVVRHGGAGEMGSPYFEIDVVYESDNEEECNNEAERLNKLNLEYTYFTYLNRNSEIGKIQKAKDEQYIKDNSHLFKNEMSIGKRDHILTGESKSQIMFTDKGWKNIEEL
jgi:hypothetical protein